MNFTIPEGIAVVALSVILGIISWSFRRMIDTQDGMAKSMATMSLDITRLCGEIKLASAMQILHKETCDGRHEENVTHLDKIDDDISSLLKRG